VPKITSLMLSPLRSSIAATFQALSANVLNHIFEPSYPFKTMALGLLCPTVRSEYPSAFTSSSFSKLRINEPPITP